MAGDDKAERLKGLMAKLLGGATAAPTLDALAVDMVKAFGGSRGFVKEYKKQYKAAASPMVKAKMLGDVMYLIKLSNANKKSTDLTTFTDADLEEVLVNAAVKLLPPTETPGAPEVYTPPTT